MILPKVVGTICGGVTVNSIGRDSPGRGIEEAAAAR